MSDDIVARLRLWSDNAKEQDAMDIVVGLCEAADEIERLHRDYSCICSEMRRMMEERDEARLQMEACRWALSSLPPIPYNNDAKHQRKEDRTNGND